MSASDNFHLYSTTVMRYGLMTPDYNTLQLPQSLGDSEIGSFSTLVPADTTLEDGTGFSSDLNWGTFLDLDSIYADNQLPCTEQARPPLSYDGGSLPPCSVDYVQAPQDVPPFLGSTTVPDVFVASVEEQACQGQAMLHPTAGQNCWDPLLPVPPPQTSLPWLGSSLPSPPSSPAVQLAPLLQQGTPAFFLPQSPSVKSPFTVSLITPPTPAPSPHSSPSKRSHAPFKEKSRKSSSLKRGKRGAIASSRMSGAADACKVALRRNKARRAAGMSEAVGGSETHDGLARAVSPVNIVQQKLHITPTRTKTPAGAKFIEKANKLECPLETCSKVCKQRQDLARHVEIHMKSFNGGPQQWVCTGVPLKYGANSPETHEVTVVNGERYVGGCKKAFCRKDSLLRHLKNQPGCLRLPFS